MHGVDFHSCAMMMQQVRLLQAGPPAIRQPLAQGTLHRLRWRLPWTPSAPPIHPRVLRPPMGCILRGSLSVSVVWPHRDQKSYPCCW